MTYSVKIVDNDTGKVIIDDNDVTCIIGAIGNDVGLHKLTATYCTSVRMAAALNDLEDMIKELDSDHQEMSQIRALMRIIGKDMKSKEM